MNATAMWTLGRLMVGVVVGVLLATDTAEANSRQSSRLVSVTGVLDVVDACDFKNGKHETHYYLGDLVSGKARQLRFERAPKRGLKTGDIVRLKARLDAAGLTVPAGSEDAVTVLPSSEPTTEKALQVRKTVVLMVNFTDKVHSLTTSQVASMMFSTTAKSVDGLYRESSFGQVAFPGDSDGDGQPDVFGPYTIPYASTSSCNYYTWGYAAEDAAMAAGVSVGSYKHIVYVFPGSSCSWAGMGNVGCGTQCRVWVNAPQHADVYAHELGHNLGMRHAATDANNDGVIDSEYGDKSDIMGYSGVGWRQFNTAHKREMGWFAATPQQVVTVTASGTYRIAPLEMDPAAAGLPQVLKVASAKTGESYWLGFRVRTGYDATLGTAYSDGCSIHRASDNGGLPTRLVTTLRDGGAFTDTTAGFTVKQVARSSDPVTGYLDLEITLNTPAPTPVAPKVSASPSRQVTNQAGAALSYSVSVTNQDASGAPASTFTVTAAVPTGWQASVTPASVSLNPGATAGFTVTVASSTTAMVGSHSVALTAGGVGRPSASASAAYVLDTNPPAAVTGVKATVDRKNKVTLSWNAATDAVSGISGYTVYRAIDGGSYTRLAQVVTLTYVDGDTGAGQSFAYVVTATDGAGNESAPSAAVTVSVASSTPPGKAPKSK